MPYSSINRTINRKVRTMKQICVQYWAETEEGSRYETTTDYIVSDAEGASAYVDEILNNRCNRYIYMYQLTIDGEKGQMLLCTPKEENN